DSAVFIFYFFSSRRRHTRSKRDWSSDVCSSDLNGLSTYVSQQSKESTDYLSALGYYQKHSWIRWSSFNNGSTAAVNRMLGLKYVIAPKNKNLLDATISGKSMSTSDSAPNFPEGVKENSSYFNIYKDKETLPIVFKKDSTAKNVVIKYNTEENT